MLPEGVQVAFAAIQTISSLPDKLKEEVRAAFAQATRQIWLVMLAVSAAGFLSCVLLREVRMRGAPEVEEDWDAKDAEMGERRSSPPASEESGSDSELPESPTQEISVEAGLLR